VYQRGVEHAEVELLLQLFAAAHFQSHGVARQRLPQPLDPGQHQRVAQAHLGAEREQFAITAWQRQVAPRGLPGLHQLAGIGGKALAIGRQPRAGAIAHEQPAAQLVFQVLYARGDGRLGDVQALGRGDEAAAANDLEKGAGEINIHGRP